MTPIKISKHQKRFHFSENPMKISKFKLLNAKNVLTKHQSTPSSPPLLGPNLDPNCVLLLSSSELNYILNLRYIWGCTVINNVKGRVICSLKVNKSPHSADTADTR